MPELVHHAYVVCRDAIDQESVISHVHWIGSSAPSQGTTFGSVAVQNGTGSSEASEVWRGKGGGRYGEWSARLKQDMWVRSSMTLTTVSTTLSAASLQA